MTKQEYKDTILRLKKHFAKEIYTASVNGYQPGSVIGYKARRDQRMIYEEFLKIYLNQEVPQCSN